MLLFLYCYLHHYYHYCHCIFLVVFVVVILLTDIIYSFVLVSRGFTKRISVFLPGRDKIHKRTIAEE